MNIVHITPHLGGGVGRILSSVAIHASDKYQHTIITLEPTETAHFEELCHKNRIKVLCYANCDIEKILEQADIVQIEWWHHPLTMKFMIDYLEKIPSRLFIWAHVSGCTYPNIPAKLTQCADAFAFTTPYSYENATWTEEERQVIQAKTHVIVSSAIDDSIKVKKQEHKSFNVGYIGFLSYSKTHPEFVAYCESAAKIPTIHYTIVGDIAYGKQLRLDVMRSYLLQNKVTFTGYTSNVKHYLKTFDVFAYPLYPKHYGTAENVLLEAMGAGIVPVVLNQCTEKYLVRHMETGLVVNNIKEYGEALKWLYEHPEQREKLGYQASQYVFQNYHIKSTLKNLNFIYEELMHANKTFHSIEDIFGKTPYEWFLTCYTGKVEELEGNALAETKGSPKHYLKYFEDEKLREVVEKNESRK